VKSSPSKGLWEVYLELGVKKGLIYVDFEKKHFFMGSLMSIKERKNLTQERFGELNKVDVSQIPLNDALVMGGQKARIRVISLHDPELTVLCKTSSGDEEDY
jgi:thiol:disulfide interchange protein DsbC